METATSFRKSLTMKNLKVILLYFFAATVLVKGQRNKYDYSNSGEVVKQVPAFTATPQEFTVEVNDEIVFPCDVENLGSEVLMFRHILPTGETRMLFIGDMGLKQKKKFTKKGNSFVLSGVTRRHAGKYECRIESETVVQLIHTLNVRYPATVRRLSPEVQRVVKGASVVLECGADGNPKAAISWSKQNGLLPSGAQSVEGMKLSFRGVDRHVEGNYICTASNGIGPPSSTTMTILVEYPPVIVTEETMLHKGEGDVVKLMCIVHGRPSPSVTWSKDGRMLDSNEQLLKEHDGLHKHILTIQNVQEEDFGEYTCGATNTHGEMHQTLTLTGLPKAPKITSDPSGPERHCYTITWETQSDSPITQYRLKYRRVQDNMVRVHGGWDDRLYFPPTAVVPGQHSFLMGPIQQMSHSFQYLQPGTDYEATVSVENKFGWSSNSEIFRFHTWKEVAVGQSVSGSDGLVNPYNIMMVMLMGIYTLIY